MKKLFVKVIEDCAQCDHMHYSYRESLYICLHPSAGRIVISRPGFPDGCPLENVAEEDIVEPGC